MRALLRRWLPLETRQQLAHLRRQWHDFTHGSLPRNERSHVPWPTQVALTQRVMPGQLFDNKLHNLRQGAQALSGSVLAPGALWSFWAVLGRPSVAQGYVEGRNLVQGQLTRQVGGGLCQLSSLVYHLALMGGLQVAERHPHSIDIYREEDRFTPLGADATVVWGFKDLRLRNPHPFALSLHCELQGDQLTARLCAASNLQPREVVFVREPLGPQQVRVHAKVGDELLQVTDYVQQQGAGLVR
jgi:vancomycin resistance protein VanW